MALFTSGCAVDSNVTELIEEIYSAFFRSNDFIKIEFDKRKVKTATGTCYFVQHRIIVHTVHPSFHQNNFILAVIAHELGHLYNYMYERELWDKSSDYELELYADDFARMCLGELWQEEFCSAYHMYKGFKAV